MHVCTHVKQPSRPGGAETGIAKQSAINTTDLMKYFMVDSSSIGIFTLSNNYFANFNLGRKFSITHTSLLALPAAKATW